MVPNDSLFTRLENIPPISGVHSHLTAFPAVLSRMIAAAACLLSFSRRQSSPGQINKALKNGALLSIDPTRSGLVTERHDVKAEEKLEP